MYAVHLYIIVVVCALTCQCGILTYIYLWYVHLHVCVWYSQNKILKEKYQIDSKGYPKIIVRQVEKSVENDSEKLQSKEVVAA